ncbi:Ig-like domain-containing protein [Herbiconiux sp. SYSU D00978]|uniref:Ig-like domain-containing protein n=1 Tax=Herbiconiux sp. SYSU D00978 TaxID=2812562 RepID=UPI001A97B9F5|nr:Ig-like domain-containing protein [Herbiconiux sp. SYSU D00978]
MTNPRRRRTRVASAVLVATVAGGVLASTPALAATAATPAAPQVTVRPDPSYQGAPFEGWGTSLVWFANATGDYPDEIKEELADLVFGEDGLNLNIARYNIGGGNAPDVPDYLRAGGAVEGWWAAPEGTTREDKDWWDPENPEHWNLEADATQRWWVDHIKQDITHWETFSNSPPYFQTVSGYVSGGFNATADQLRPESIEDFATYLVRVTEELETAHGITVDTLDPFNEPNTNYWSTRLGADGNPTGGRQEGAHMSPQLQQQVLPAVAAALEGASTEAVISAMDETNPGIFATNWNSYPEEVRDLVDQLNVHTYGTGQRTTARDIAKGEDKPLWMSEVEGSWGDRQDFESMVPGLGMADRIVDDLRELEPTAWVFWQPVEDYDNMKPGGESALGANWGSIQLPFDCTSTDTLETCPIYTNTKFDTVRNFTHFIEPGDRLVGVNDTASVAAIDGEGGATVVHINDTAEARSVALDLSGFATVSAGATVTPVVTDASGALVEGAPVAVEDGTAVLRVPAQSVTTFLVDGVDGVAAGVGLVQDGHRYQLEGVQSGRVLTAGETGATITDADSANGSQLFTLTKLEGDDSNRAQYAVTDDAGRHLAVAADGSVGFVPAAESPGASARWILSTTGDGTYTFVNVASKRLLEVGGQSTANGAAAATWLANSGDNQRWRLKDRTIVGVDGATAFTLPGERPTLPATVEALYRDGSREAIPVTWKLPPDARWKKPATVTVKGEATDPQGGVHRVEAVVEVDRLVSTLPAAAKAVVGGEAQLPTTVTAVGSEGAVTERPVTWDTTGVVFDAVGTVEVPGTAEAGDGSTLPATARVQVTEATETNVAREAGVRISATFTEPGYGTAGLNNGDLRDKAWSNWRSSSKNAFDTLTVTLPERQQVTGMTVHFYRDGSHLSFAENVTVEARNADGSWTRVASTSVPADATGGPSVPVTFAAVQTDAVRAVLDARANTHMTVAELEVIGLGAPGVSSDATLAGISLDGRALEGFAPDDTEYSVSAKGTPPQVAVLPSDPYATVAIEQATPNARTATVTVTSEDGSATSTYTVEFTR